MTNTLEKISQRWKVAGNYLAWRLGRSAHESVYFYTLHKCASTLFGAYVLKNVRGLRNVSYAGQIYLGKQVREIRFEPMGHIYGPIRIAPDPTSPVYRRFVEPACRPEFVQDKVAIFLLRDPRDILVSAYYSFGFSHRYSPVPEIREGQQRMRQKIQALSLDEYAREAADAVLEYFRTVDRLNRICERSVVLRYEDLVNDFDTFMQDFTRYVDLKPSVIEQMFQRSRPKEKENTSSHRRSGKTGGFRGKLKDETIAALNTTFASVLERLRYEP